MPQPNVQPQPSDPWNDFSQAVWGSRAAQPLVRYFERQNKDARDSMDFAQWGSDLARGGNPLGVIPQALGTAGYVASPLSALIPRGAEKDLPEWAQPAGKAALDFADYFMPGPSELASIAGASKAIFLPFAPGIDIPRAGMDRYMNRMEDLYNKKGETDINELRKVFRETRYSQPTADQELLFHVPDENAQFTLDAQNYLAAPNSEPFVGTLPDVVHHPELYQRMPELRDMKTVLTHEPWQVFGGGHFGAYSDQAVHAAKGRRDTLDDVMDIYMHEISHGIDRRTGRAKDWPGLTPFGSPEYFAKILADEAQRAHPEKILDFEAMPEVLANSGWNLYTRNQSETLARLVEQMRQNARPNATARMRHWAQMPSGILPQYLPHDPSSVRTTPEELLSIQPSQQIQNHSMQSPSIDFGFDEAERRRLLRDIAAAMEVPRDPF